MYGLGDINIQSVAQDLSVQVAFQLRFGKSWAWVQEEEENSCWKKQVVSARALGMKVLGNLKKLKDQCGYPCSHTLS